MQCSGVAVIYAQKKRGPSALGICIQCSSVACSHGQLTGGPPALGIWAYFYM